MRSLISLLLYIAPVLAAYEAGYPFDAPGQPDPNDPSKITHSITRTAELFPGQFSHLSSQYGAMEKRKIANVAPIAVQDGNEDNDLNPHGRHTTLNNYQSTPTPGIHFCSRPRFQGTCAYQPAIANPKKCNLVPPGPWTKGGSFLVEKDIQCAFHSSPDCSTPQHTLGLFFWPEVISLFPNQRGLGSQILAYKCRQCLGCNVGNHPDWDGNSTQKLEGAFAQPVLLGTDQNGHLTNYSPGGAGKPIKAKGS